MWNVLQSYRLDELTIDRGPAHRGYHSLVINWLLNQHLSTFKETKKQIKISDTLTTTGQSLWQCSMMVSALI